MEDGEGTNWAFALLLSLFTSFILVSLVMTERVLEDPFLLAAFTNYVGFEQSQC